MMNDTRLIELAYAKAKSEGRVVLFYILMMALIEADKKVAQKIADTEA